MGRTAGKPVRVGVSGRRGGLGLDDAIARALAREPASAPPGSTVDVPAASGSRRPCAPIPVPRRAPRRAGGNRHADRRRRGMAARAVPRDRAGFQTAEQEYRGALTVGRPRATARRRRARPIRRARGGHPGRRRGRELAVTVERQVDLCGRARRGAAPPTRARTCSRSRCGGCRPSATCARAGRTAPSWLLKPLLGMEAGRAATAARDARYAVVSGHPLSPDRSARCARPAKRRASSAPSASRSPTPDRAGRREGRFDMSLFGGYMRMDSGFPQLGVSPLVTPERVRGQFHYVSGGATVMLPMLNRNQGASGSRPSGAGERGRAAPGARACGGAEVAAARHDTGARRSARGIRRRHTGPRSAES